jgi:hypothetical protein
MKSAQKTHNLPRLKIFEPWKFKMRFKMRHAVVESVKIWSNPDARTNGENTRATLEIRILPCLTVASFVI